MSDMRIDDALAAKVTAKLIELQAGDTDTAFAARLGVTRPHWWNVKRGRRRASYALVKRAAQQFPGISEIVLLDLAGVA